MVRSLLITAESPYPPTSGVPVRNWQHINTLSAFGPVGLVSIGTKQPEAEVPIVQYQRHVTVENPRTPEKPRIAYPILTEEQSKQARPVINQAIRDFDPDVVIFSNLVLAEPVDPASKFRCVFDSHNVYASVAKELGPPDPRVHALEAQQMLLFDRIWLCSESDERLVSNLYGTAISTAVVPNGVDVDYYRAVRDGAYRSLRKVAPTLAFVGAYWYAPNRIGAEWLIDQVTPFLRATLPSCRVLFIGATPSEKMIEAAGRDRSITVIGVVPDVRPFLGAADIVVVPIFQGGGTRLKILEAFAAGRPVVSTAKGVEGLGVTDGVDVLIRDTPEGFAQAVEVLWKDRGLAKRLAGAAYSLVTNRYSWTAAGLRLQKALRSLDR